MTEPSWQHEDGGAHDQTLEENWLFRLRRERFRSRASGKAHDYYVVHLADAVNVIALTPDRRLILVRQFRAGSGHDSLETPGGLLEPGEDPRDAGARELLEETGYAGKPAELLGTVWSNPSIMTSKTTYIVIADAQRVAEPRLDYNEEVIVELVPDSSVPLLIREGRIDHALVVCGLLWWLQARFPGALATPGRSVPLKIRTIMLFILVLALFFGMVANASNPVGGFLVVVLIVSLVLFTTFTTAAALGWRFPFSR